MALIAIVEELIDSDEDMDVICQYLKHTVKKRRVAISNYEANVLMLYDLDDFRNNFRLSRVTFEHLITVLGPHLTHTETGVGRHAYSIEKQLLVTLSMLSNQEVYRISSEKFNISTSTAWHYVHKISSILVTLSSTYIRWPRGETVVNVIKKFRERQGFDGVVGAIDGSHILIATPSYQQASYCNRNRYHSIILQAICDSNYIFTDVFAGYPGSVHNARVFRNSPIGKKLNEHPLELLPHNTHILGDSAYANTTYLLTPFKDNGHLSRRQKVFKYKHSATRCYIEQAFGLLKGRFRILKHVNVYKTEKIPNIIIACCVLHNFVWYNKMILLFKLTVIIAVTV